MAYNNVYLVVDGGERLLVDTGPDYAGAFESLRESLGPELPDAVVATHAHIDHAGLGAAWQELGVPVYVGAGDAHLTHSIPLQDVEFANMCEFVRLTGAPADVQDEVLAELHRRKVYVREIYRADATHPHVRIRDRWPTPLRFRPFTPLTLHNEADLPAGMRWVACPGHTPGNGVLWHPGEGWLFSGDQLLPGITPTPPIQSRPPGAPGEWRFHSLPEFARSLAHLRDLATPHCYPGHGEPFDDVESAVQANLTQIAERGERILEALRMGGPATLYELGERLYPRALRRRFWQIISTLQGNLDLLAEQGRARSEGNTWLAT